MAPKNHRVDAFLKRNLPPNEYETLRSFEPCVIVSDREKHVFRYIVLSNDNLYLTENPPRNVQLLTKLGDIFSMEMIYDLPSFLSGEDREKCQHIRIQYFIDDGMLYSQTLSNLPMKLSKGMNQANTRMSNSMPNSTINEPSLSDGNESRNKFGGSTNQLSHSLLEQRKLPERPKLQSRDDYAIKSSTATACVPRSTVRKKTVQNKNLAPNFTDAEEKISTNDLQNFYNLIDRNQTVVDIYILSDTSKMPMYMHSTWENYMMRQTLEMDANYLRKLGTNKSSKHLTEQQLQLFNQLKEEILTSTKLEEIYVLLQELNTACIRNYSLKKLFWKTPDLFNYIATSLADVTCSSNREISHWRLPQSRADTLEAQMLLKLINGAVTSTSSNSMNSILNLQRPHFSRLLEYEKWHSAEDNENMILEKNITDAAAAVIFEIVLVTQQMLVCCNVKFSKYFSQMKYWGDVIPLMNIWWLINFLESKQEKSENFIKRITDAALEKLSNTGNEFLSPLEIAQLYQKFTILSTLIQNSKKFAEYIKCNYAEEFKYFVQTPLLQQKLLGKYPLSVPTYKLINTIMEFVVG
ncbi:uncharacterized protein TRIADDRAFT_52430 [Trichoplax adhaerens]|uniref:Uncharacterized protein n=1 Tax=Trichoplax adhaerens TaxID=10228 RepID=B3RIC9_TRIAD|nr:hypothetical protein TRIADDRAFT_52430 [Trichoplax adhaerens]EDV29730.1 hypothetical protein TRIADDRAFT_52430 [Trichoplax adhaerens]|eukprot:XP_002108932.1 hypothetical protein TRIADDRAFT_52430 [Trichoplax adhaerens]